MSFTHLSDIFCEIRNGADVPDASVRLSLHAMQGTYPAIADHDACRDDSMDVCEYSSGSLSAWLPEYLSEAPTSMAQLPLQMPTAVP